MAKTRGAITAAEMQEVLRKKAEYLTLEEVQALLTRDGGTKTQPESGQSVNDCALDERIADDAGSNPAPSTHPCKRCTRDIDSRYPFRVCVRCSLDMLEETLNEQGYHEARRKAAYERLAAAGLLKEK